MQHTSSRYVLAALVLELTAGREIQLVPAGEFRGTDGRPREVGAWRIDAAIARSVIAAASARTNRFVIDYEHQTLLAKENGQAAPAAGWFKTLEWRDGQGLYAVDVEWTARAKQMIEAGEYRYLSPVFGYHPKTGEVQRVLMAAVTNVPAVDGMDELMERAAARFDLNSQEIHMSPLLKSLLAVLSLAETTSESDAIAAVTQLKTRADKTGTLETEVAALKAATPDPAKFVPVTAMQEMQTQVATLTSTIAQRDLDEVVSKALTDGKLLPAQESWARELGKKDIAALRSFIETAQALPALRGTQSQGRQPGTQAAGGDIVAVAKQEFETNAALREEFIDLPTYTAWRKAEAAGTVKVLGRRAA